MEDNTSQNARQPHVIEGWVGRGFRLIPWAGGFFWVFLWLWIMAPHGHLEVPTEQGVIGENLPPGIQLKGFRIRQETPYSDDKFTYLDLHAERGRSVEGAEDTHALSKVIVKLVTRGKTETGAADLRSKLSDKAEVAWVLILSETGIYSFKTRDIDLIGNVQVYGYTLSGELAEWMAADRLLYDWSAGRVRSLGPATYEGRSFPLGQPCRAHIDADVNLNDIHITEKEDLSETYQTPMRFPELRPPYSPPEALKFLAGNQLAQKG